MSDLDAFLAAVSVFADLDPAERAAVASRCRERALPAGARLLAQGAPNGSLFVLRSGQLAVIALQGHRRETIARLGPHAVIGELSFLTGRACSADVDALVDSVVLEFSLDALTTLTGPHERIVRGLAHVVAERLHGVVSGDAAAAAAPIVLLRTGRAWAAPRAAALELAGALARERAGEALLVRVGDADGPAAPEPVRNAENEVASVSVRADVAADGASGLAARLPEWTRRYAAIVIAASDAGRTEPLRAIAPVGTHTCDFVGPGDPAPSAGGAAELVAQDARHPSLPVLDGRHRLVADVVEAEQAWAAGQRAGERFRAGIGALARAVLGTQVGVALGAGGARGWCHAGVLAALSEAGLPIDVVAGTSMGAVVGGLWAIGADARALDEAAAEWRRRRRRLREWRLWRLHMASERGLDELFLHYFGDRAVNATNIPFRANATDIERGEEVVLETGLLRNVARASMAFPGWTPPVALDGRLLVDGAVINPAPAQTTRDMGAGFVITVLAIGPSPPQPLATRFPAKAYDAFVRTFHLSGVAMGHARSEAASDVLIVPDLGDATMLSFDRDRELIAAGHRTARMQLPAILEAYAALTRARRATP